MSQFPMGPNYGPPGGQTPQRPPLPANVPPPPPPSGIRPGTAGSFPPRPVPMGPISGTLGGQTRLPPAVNQTLQNIGRYLPPDPALAGTLPPTHPLNPYQSLYAPPLSPASRVPLDAALQRTPQEVERRLLDDVRGGMPYALPPPMNFGVTSPQSSTVLNPNVVPQHRLTTQEVLRQNELRRQNELMQRGLPPGGPPPGGPR
jgi:hypothetical protein